MSTIIIGGGGHAAVQRLADAYPHMSHDRKAAAVALEQKLIAEVDKFLRKDDQGDDEP